MNAMELPNLMRKLSLALEELSQEQIDGILNNEVGLKIALVPVRLKNEAPNVVAEVEECVQKLGGMNDRNSGIELLSSLKKVVLQALAKRFDLSVDSSASKEKLTERIVERAIGLRLRQDAFAQLS